MEQLRLKMEEEARKIAHGKFTFVVVEQNSLTILAF